MKKIILTLSYCIGLIAYAQNKTVYETFDETTELEEIVIKTELDSVKAKVLSHVDSLYQVGKKYHWLDKNYIKAKEAYQASINLAQENKIYSKYRAHNGIFLCYRAMQQDSIAFVYSDSIIKQYPRSAILKVNRALLLKDYNQFKEAFKYAYQALEISPQNPYALDVLSSIYYENGDYDKALEYNLKLIQSKYQHNIKDRYLKNINIYLKQNNLRKVKFAIHRAYNKAENHTDSLKIQDYEQRYKFQIYLKGKPKTKIRKTMDSTETMEAQIDF